MAAAVYAALRLWNVALTYELNESCQNGERTTPKLCSITEQGSFISQWSFDACISHEHSFC